MEELATLARADGPYGEVVLRRRSRGDTAVDELIVNGAFAMDSFETSSERALATLPFPFAGARVLLGGLGLGYTASELLTQGIASLDVAELEPALVDWARQGVTVVLGGVAADPRVRLRVADIATVLARRSPQGGGTRSCSTSTTDRTSSSTPTMPLSTDRPGYGWRTNGCTPGGLLAVWCQGPSPALRETLEALGSSTDEYHHRVRRGRREWSYVIYTVRRDPAG